MLSVAFTRGSLALQIGGCVLISLQFLSLLAISAATDGWVLVARTDGIEVFNRAHAGSPLKEVIATGLVEAPPARVWQVLRDFENYPKTMPYTDESKVMVREDGERITHLYAVINAPLVSKRDYTVRLVDESKDGRYLMTWKPSEKGPALRNGVIRVTTNEGYWLLEPRDDGKRTHVVYYLFTDPGGSLPTWLVNSVNRSTIPDIFKSLRREVKKMPESTTAKG